MIVNRVQQSASTPNEIMVDALDEGSIVRVPESYARREGLPILRKWTAPQAQVRLANKLGPKETGGMDTFRRPLKKDSGGVRDALLENFHWVLSQRRKRMNISRKQLATAVGGTEQEIKLLENGVLPTNDFILISAVERHCGISLRKDGPASAPPATSLRPARSVLAGGSVPAFGSSELREQRSNNTRPAREKDSDFSKADDLLGDHIELVDEQ